MQKQKQKTQTKQKTDILLMAVPGYQGNVDWSLLCPWYIGDVQQPHDSKCQ